MTINSVPASAALRTPRGLIEVDGTEISATDGLIEMEWENNSFFEADTFRISLAASALPEAFRADYFGDTVDIPVEIFAGFPDDPDDYAAGDLDSMLYGKVDAVEYSLDQAVLVLTGRDLTAKLIDTKTDEKYPNQTSSNIVKSIAAAQGLTPKVTATSTLVGHYYEIDHVRLADNQTLWDLICYLAQQEGFIAYVSGKELHFEAPPVSDADPYLFQWTAPAVAGEPPEGNFTGLNLSRSLTVAKDITVKVRSFNSKLNTTFSATSKVSHAKSSSTSITYVYNIPGLTFAQAQARAKNIVSELAKHERKATVTGPADNLLSITDMVKIDGTGTAWDQTYFVEAISRSLSFSEGYRWSVSLKNMSPASVTSA